MRRTLKVVAGSPLAKVERGRVREGEGRYQLSGRPSFYRTHVGTILATILLIKNNVAKTMPKREPMGIQMDAMGRSKSTKNMKK